MKALAKLVTARICDEETALRAGMFLCFAAGVAVFLIGIMGLTRMGPTRVEGLIGVCAIGSLAMNTVTMGLVLGSWAERRKG